MGTLLWDSLDSSALKQGPYGMDLAVVGTGKGQALHGLPPIFWYGSHLPEKLLLGVEDSQEHHHVSF